LSTIEQRNRRVIITGVGFREPPDGPPEGNIFATPGLRPNIGAAIAREAVLLGFSVVLVARTSSKLERVRASIINSFPSADVIICPTDLLETQAVKELARKLPSDLELDLVHSAGVGAGNYKLPDDNPYLAVDKTPIELPTIEFEAVVKTLLTIIQALLPRWRQQSNTRIVVVSSMSAIRAVPFGFSHSSSKAGLHQAVRSLTLELNPEGIQVSEVLPGIVNTGFYDSPSVDEVVRRMGQNFGYQYEPGQLPQMEPRAVAEAVMLCLTSSAHLLLVSMVAKGQFPQHGA
jgi:short-subunit dehydrogenase